MKPLTRVAIVVGEASGDILGAGLIRALKSRHPSCRFEGIGGPLMLKEGFQSHFPQDRLAVMGLIEPLKRLRELLGIRNSLRERYTQNPPDLFIGIDSPDFNLPLEKSLREQGVTTAHYVSPSVWAWRQGRIHGIAKSVDLMLTLFPFEAKFYHDHNVPVAFVGHTLADEIPIDDQIVEHRQRLNIPADANVLAVLPGSRRSEVEKLGNLFFQVATQCASVYPELRILVPAANEARYNELKTIITAFPNLNVELSLANSREVMAVSNVVLMASGTTSLEAMLLKKPMVIAYKMASLSFWILKRLVKSKYIGLPNLLADKSLVPEFIQDEAQVETISKKLVTYLAGDESTHKLVEEFSAIHKSLKKSANERAADALEQLWSEKC